MLVFGVTVLVATMVAAGLLAGRFVKGEASNFLLAGRNLGAPIVAVMLMSQCIDSNATIGSADLSGAFGFWAGAAMPIGMAVSVLVLGVFIARRFRGLGFLSVADYFERRFGRSAELTAALLTVGSFSILLAGNLVSLGFLMQHFVGIGYTLAVVLLVPLVLLYTVTGGMFASAFTSVVQFFVTAVGFTALAVWMGATHGYSAPAGLGAADLGQLTDPAQGAAVNWATIASLGLGNIVAIDLMQRILSAKSPVAARNACFMAATAILVLCVPLSMVAVAALSFVDPADGPILITLLGEHTPMVLAIVVLAGLVMASLTTVGGVLLSASTVFVHNVLHLSGEDAEQSDRMARMTRVVMVPVALVGAVVALRIPTTGILLTLTFDLLLASLTVPFLAGLFWRRGTSAAFAASVALGLGTRLVFFVLTPTIYGVDNTLLYFANDVVPASVDGWTTFISALVSLVTYVVVAVLTRPATAECYASTRVVPVPAAPPADKDVVPA